MIRAKLKQPFRRNPGEVSAEQENGNATEQVDMIEVEDGADGFIGHELLFILI